MAYAVSYTESAHRQLLKLPRVVQARIVRAVEHLADDPRPPGCKKLVGTEDVWRIRVGDYRVLYQIFDAAFDVLVIRVAPRKDVY